MQRKFVFSSSILKWHRKNVDPEDLFDSLEEGRQNPRRLPHESKWIWFRTRVEGFDSNWIYWKFAIFREKRLDYPLRRRSDISKRRKEGGGEGKKKHTRRCLKRRRVKDGKHCLRVSWSIWTQAEDTHRPDGRVALHTSTLTSSCRICVSHLAFSYFRFFSSAVMVCIVHNVMENRVTVEYFTSRRRKKCVANFSRHFRWLTSEKT